MLVFTNVVVFDPAPGTWANPFGGLPHGVYEVGQVGGRIEIEADFADRCRKNENAL